jgi:hypothetical protein
MGTDRPASAGAPLQLPGRTVLRPHHYWHPATVIQGKHQSVEPICDENPCNTISFVLLEGSPARALQFGLYFLPQFKIIITNLTFFPNQDTEITANALY